MAAVTGVPVPADLEPASRRVEVRLLPSGPQPPVQASRRVDAGCAERSRRSALDEVRLTVVIAIHNRAELLAEQLEALAGQRYQRWWEVIVADNGSTDDAVGLARSFERRLPLRIIDASARPGKCFAVNLAVGQARGNALLLLDSDDVVAEGYLTEMAAALASSAFVGARLDTARLNPAWVRGRRSPLQEDDLPRWIGRRPVVIGAGLGVRIDAFVQVGGLDERMVSQEDLDLSWRLQDAGHPPRFVPEALVHYRYRQDLRGIWRQEHGYGRFEAELYAKHRPAELTATRRGRRALAGWLAIVRALPGARHRPGRARLVTVIAAALGRFEGSIRCRVLYL
jgi:GT2 family glycosyltransferase